MKSIRISESEWQIMALYGTSSGSSGDGCGEIIASKRVAFAHNSHVVGPAGPQRRAEHHAGGEALPLRPLISLEECVQSESRSFVDRVFGGEPASMLLHLVKKRSFPARKSGSLRSCCRKGEMNVLPFLNWLLRTSWQASVLVLLVLAAQWLFRRRLNAHWQFTLWFW